MGSEDSFSWSQIFGDRLLSKKGDKVVQVPTADLAGKHVGIYFSAHWCPPCRQFTPSLAQTYRTLQEQGKAFEVVFVSMDKTPQQFDEYFESMPWLAVPFADDQLRNVLIRKFQCMGIPHLVMLAPDSTILSANARATVAADLAGQKFPWAGAKEPSGIPMHWILLAMLIFFVVNHFFLKNPSAGDAPAAS